MKLPSGTQSYVDKVHVVSSYTKITSSSSRSREQSEEPRTTTGLRNQITSNEFICRVFVMWDVLML